MYSRVSHNKIRRWNAAGSNGFMFLLLMTVIFCGPVYSGFSDDSGSSTGIDRSFIQNEISGINAQIQDLNTAIKDLNSRKEAFKAVISIIQTQRNLKNLTARSNELKSKISAAVPGKTAKRRSKMTDELAMLNKEIFIRNEMLELYRLQLDGDKNMQKGKIRNLRNIQEQLKIRDEEIAALYQDQKKTGPVIPEPNGNSAAAAITPDDADIRALSARILNIDNEIETDSQKINVLVKQRIPLEMQLKGI
jgi:hypothetical protein